MVRRYMETQLQNLNQSEHLDKEKFQLMIVKGIVFLFLSLMNIIEINLFQMSRGS